MAITTNSSMSVKAERERRRDTVILLDDEDVTGAWR
jgi:hypothetical protein